MAAAGCTSAPSCACLIVGEIVFPVYPAERFVLNGEVKVMLLTMLFAIDEFNSIALGKGRI